eukprot:TCONS_00059522-protein
MKTTFVFVTLALAYASALTFGDADGKLTCGSNSMTITLDKDKFDQHGRQFRLHFKGATDPACTVKSDAGADGALTITSNYNACGIVLAVAEEVSYSQTVLVTYGKTPNSFVQREEVISFEVSCNVDAAVAVGLAGAGHVNVTSLEEQTISKSEASEFDIKLVRTTDGSFSSEHSSSQMRLGDQMYFKLELNTIRDDLKISPQTCYASSTKDSSERYLLIEDGGCPNMADGTISIPYENDQKLFKWENEAFRFFGDSDAVYITCNVNVCNSNDYGDDCLRCNSIKRRRRRRRAVFHFNEEKINTKQQRVIVSTQVYKLI